MPVSSQKHAARRITLDLAPAEVAARLRHLPGLAFFDTAKPDDANALSIVAAAPREILRGHIARDWDTLRVALAARECAQSGDDGLPHGFAAGRVDYDGAFCFGMYDEALLFRHSEQRWYSVGDLASRMHVSPADATCARPDFQPVMPREKFLAMVRRAQEYIAAGDIYQVNLSHRFESP